MSMNPGSTYRFPTSSTGAWLNPGTVVPAPVTASMRSSRIQTRPGAGSLASPSTIGATSPLITSSLTGWP